MTKPGDSPEVLAEKLRERLINLERSSRHEHQHRIEAEGLLEGLRILIEAQSTDDVFDNLSEVLRRFIPFEEAFVLIQTSESILRVFRSTAPVFQRTRWTVRGSFRRVLDGQTVAAFDVARVPEWQDQSEAVTSEVCSAVHTPLRLGSLSAILVLVHRQRGFFDGNHVHLAKRLAPLTNQVLLSFEYRSKLEAERNAAEEANLAKTREIEDRRRAEAELSWVNSLIGDVISFAPVYVWEIDEKGYYTYALGSEKLLGFTPEEIVGCHFTRFVEEDESGAREEIVEAEATRVPYENVGMKRRCKDGRQIWTSISAKPVFDGDGLFRGYRGVTVDVTDAKEATNRLEEMALHDALTGLANRRLFIDHFETEAARQQRHRRPLSMLVLDVDHFKDVNDEYGHAAGDECLCQIAFSLDHEVRTVDLAARFGGEEFIVLLPETDGEGALLVAEKVRSAIEATPAVFEVERETHRRGLTVSIGVATMEAGAPLSFDEILKSADHAMYEAKRSGRNRVCSHGVP